MGWGWLKAILEALLPFLFKKRSDHARESEQAPDDLRESWADRIRDGLSDEGGGADSTDSVGGGEAE